MKIANADKLKQHFENVVDVKLFTPAQICTIIDTFSSEADENDLISRSALKELPFEKVIYTDFGDTAIPIEEIDNAPAVFGGAEP